MLSFFIMRRNEKMSQAMTSVTTPLIVADFIASLPMSNDECDKYHSTKVANCMRMGETEVCSELVAAVSMPQ
jgi:hypothetical protein